MASLVVLVALTFFLIRQSNPGWLQIIALWLLVFLLGQTGARWVGCLPRSRIMLPRYIAEYLASALAMAACCIWYVTEGTAVLGRYVAIALLVAAAYQLVVVAVLAAVATKTMATLRLDYRAGRLPSMRPPYAVICSVRSRHLKRAVVFSLMKHLWRFSLHSESDAGARRYIVLERDIDTALDRARAGGATGLRMAMRMAPELARLLSRLFREQWADRSLMGFLDSSDLAVWPVEFQQYVLANAAALIGHVSIVEEPFVTGELIAQFETGRWVLTDRRLRRTAIFPTPTAGSGDRLTPIARTVIWLTAKLMNAMRVGTFETFYEATQALRRELHLCRGPSVIVNVNARAPFRTASSVRGYEVVVVPPGRPQEVVPPVAQALATSALPAARADAKLPLVLRGTITTLAERGLGPLADCYLRFRLSRSDVERFLALLDCIEVIVKYCVIACAAETQARSSQQDRGALIEALERPSLGTWTSVLRSLVQVADRVAPLGGPLRSFWAQRPEPPTRELIDAVNGLGLSWKGEMPRSHLGWLDWVTWLRNVTKGHGGVEETLVGPIWEQLHAAVLRLIHELGTLTLEAALVVRDARAQAVTLTGWLRGPARTSTLPFGAEDPEEDRGYAMLSCGSTEYDLFPFTRVKGDRCLTWNSRRGGMVEYVDYASGLLESVRPGEADQVRMWGQGC